MKLRVAALVVVVVALFSGSAFAQPTMDFSVKGGIGFGTMSFENDDFSRFYDGSRTGFIIGGGASIPVNDMFSLVIEGLYNQKGSTGSSSGVQPGIEGTFKIDYVEIPILFNVPFNTMSNVRPFAYGGFAPAFKVSAKGVLESAGEEVELDLDEDIKSFDSSLVLGGGVRFGQMAAEARVSFGLQNINDVDSLGDMKTRQLAFLFSYLFGGN